MTPRILSVLVALILALNIGAAALSAGTTYNFTWVFLKDSFSNTWWEQHVSSYEPPGCDTGAAGAADGYVRCSADEPTEQLDPEGAVDWMEAHAPVSIMD